MTDLARKTPSVQDTVHTESSRGADVGYLAKLRQNLIDSFSEDELRTLCADLKLDYDHLAGQGKADKVSALVSYLRRAGRIHELVKICSELRRGVHWADIPKVPRESFPPEKKRFLRAFFGGQSVAFEEDLCKSWEFGVTRLIYRFFPRLVGRQIASLSNDVASIDYIADSKPTELEKPLMSQTSREQVPQEKSEGDSKSRPFDQSFVNYHSVGVWYGTLRSGAKLLLLPLIFVIIGSLALLCGLVLGAALTFVSVFGGGIPEQNNPGIVYTVPVSGDYYVEVKDTAPRSHDYTFGVFQASRDIVSPDFTQTSIWSISYGQQVFSRMNSHQQHLYRVESKIGEDIIVRLYRWYADTDLDFVLLNSEMNECDTASLLKSDLGSKNPTLSCMVDSTGPYYIRVQMRTTFSDAPFETSSRYGFEIYQVLDVTDAEPNDDIESSVDIPQGTFIWANLSTFDQDWYCFTAQADQRLEISAFGLSDSNLSSVTLYRPVADGYELIAHSTRSSPGDLEVEKRLLETPRGRALLASTLLNSFGFGTSPVDLVQSSWEYWVIVLLPSLPPLLLVEFFVVFFVGYALFVKNLSERKYHESTAVRHIVNVLTRLKDNNALRSERNKAGIRATIDLASEQIRKIHKTAWVAPPTEMEKHLARIASQTAHMKAKVSIPGPETLPYLRRRFVEWLDVFLKAEYGLFQFTEGSHPASKPWHRQIIYSVQRHWKRIVGVVILAPILMFLTQLLWGDHWIELLTWTWLATRYVILIVAVYAVYSYCETRGPRERSKWQNAVRLILFFFIPLFAFDVLLQTGIVDKIIQFVGSLKIF